VRVEGSSCRALAERLTVAAGYTNIDAQVQYQSGVGNRVAIGPTPGLFRANLQYRPRLVDGLILETKIENTSNRYARYRDLTLPAITTVDIGGRYNSHIFGNPATYRLQVYNVTSEYSVNAGSSGMLSPLDARHFELSLAVDL